MESADHGLGVVSPVGLEPTTHSLKGCRSNRLSYGPAQGLNYTRSGLFFAMADFSDRTMSHFVASNSIQLPQGYH